MRSCSDPKMYWRSNILNSPPSAENFSCFSLLVSMDRQSLPSSPKSNDMMGCAMCFPPNADRKRSIPLSLSRLCVRVSHCGLECFL